eukprot:gnl/Carplike_NY0171/11431_a16311_98.p1 GENE.gnl/Carplike_NY0171/11431_a16311_98~~gnl/Carplike_NY0171/11431_a16311_98.p1  ORF type:complete len:102 (+),score=19.59 gnl/Carplike_NY0171/11431_a16311_98:93-398(+)
METGFTPETIKASLEDRFLKEDRMFLSKKKLHFLSRELESVSEAYVSFKSVESKPYWYSSGGTFFLLEKKDVLDNLDIQRGKISADIEVEKRKLKEIKETR